jgi:hypothetical protein
MIWEMKIKTNSFNFSDKYRVIKGVKINMKFSICLFIALAPAFAFADLLATAQHGPSPSDGDRINIEIVASGVTLALDSDSDIHDFEVGKIVKIKMPEGVGSKSAARRKDPSSRLGFKFIEAEISIDPKTHLGFTVIEKKKEKIKLTWLPSLHGRGGR